MSVGLNREIGRQANPFELAHRGRTQFAFKFDDDIRLV
jgi:hypothetical protein